MSSAFCAAAIEHAIVILVGHLIVSLLGFCINRKGSRVLASAFRSSVLVVLMSFSIDKNNADYLH